MNALINQQVPKAYIDILKDIYSGGTSSIRLHKDSDRFVLERGVRQGDTISPKLFTACLEEVFMNICWVNKGVVVDGERLTHLRFADDIVVFAESGEELQSMIKDLKEASQAVGLEMNLSKTKVMFNRHASSRIISAGSSTLEEVESYLYLGQLVTANHDMEPEVKRRIAIGWQAFAKYNKVWKSTLPTCLKRKVLDQCVIPSMTYGSETWVLSKTLLKKLASSQSKMERRILGITWKDKKTNIWVRNQTKCMGINQRIKSLKWKWAGHVARRDDNRWTHRATFWQDTTFKRGRGRPKQRWVDDIQKFAGRDWKETAQSRGVWASMGEAFALQWAI